jgi:putative Mg2+ transporter-C (MgtC) family protein
MADLSFTQNDLLIRLSVALACGAALGFNRDLHGKPAGLRTFALVSLAAATVSVLVVNSGSSDFASVSRVMQGMLTGVGFLGAGVILHPDAQRVAGLTTAASVLVAAAMGMAAGLGEYRIAGAVLLLALLVLVAGGRLEHWLMRVVRRPPGEPPPGSGD